MKEPTRLLAGEADELERELLGSWNAEQPSNEARTKVLAMAGLGVAGTAAVVAEVGGSLAPKAGTTGAALVKWLLLGAVGLVAAGGSLAYVARAHRRPSSPSLVTPAAPAVPTVNPALTVGAPTPSALAPRSEVPAVASSLVAQDAPSRPPTLHHAPSAATADRSARSRNDALGEQVAVLDRARKTLADGDASGALRELDGYASRFPHGALVEEAEALRVESLLAANDRPAATQAGARFLAAHPSSPLATRVRALLGQAPGP